MHVNGKIGLGFCRLKTADEVEGLLIQEKRQLGNTSRAEWATQAETRVSMELQGLAASVRSRKNR